MYLNQSKFIKAKSSPGGNRGNRNADLNRWCEGKNCHIQTVHENGKLDGSEEHGGKYVSSFCQEQGNSFKLKFIHLQECYLKYNIYSLCSGFYQKNLMGVLAIFSTGTYAIIGTTCV